MADIPRGSNPERSEEEMEEMFMKKLNEGKANLSEIPKTVAVKFLNEIANLEKEKN